MSADRDMTRIVRSWLRTDEHESADRVLDNVLALVETTPQRRSVWPARRIADMHTYAKLAIGAAALVVVAVVGLNLLPVSGGVGGAPAVTPSPSPSPSPTSAPPSPSSSAAPVTSWPFGSLDSGRHAAALRPCDPRGPQFGCDPDVVSFSFNLPSDGWKSINEGILEFGTFPDSFAWIWLMQSIHAVSTDPCAGQSSQATPSVAGLAEALTTIAGTDPVGPTDVTVGGVPGKLVVLTIHDDIACDISHFWLLGDGSLYPNTIGSTIKLRTVEVNGSPVTVYSDQASPNPELEQEIEEIVDSIQFE